MSPVEHIDPLALDVYRYGLGDTWRTLDATCQRMAEAGHGWAPGVMISEALRRLVALGWAERAVPGYRRRRVEQQRLEARA